MVGEGRRIARLSRGLPVALIGLVAAVLATPAAALNLTAQTNRGGRCHIYTSASRTGTVIKYGVKVNDCSTRFGVRYIVSQGALYDKTDQIRVADGDMDRKKGHPAYSNSRRVTGTDTSHAYQTVIDLSIVLKTRRDRSTRHPERWLDPGKRCRVTTTWHDGDTLGCTLNDNLAPG